MFAAGTRVPVFHSVDDGVAVTDAARWCALPWGAVVKDFLCFLLQGQGFQSSMVSMMGPQGQMAPGGVRMAGPMSGLSAAQQAAVRASMQAVRCVDDSNTNNKNGDLTSVHFPHKVGTQSTLQ